jgi:hypothetical protein
MEPQQLEEICNEIQLLHKPMKNAIEIVFATTPLLALSTHSWSPHSFNSIYLLRVSDPLAFLLPLVEDIQDFYWPR